MGCLLKYIVKIIMKFILMSKYLLLGAHVGRDGQETYPCRVNVYLLYVSDYS